MKRLCIAFLLMGLCLVYGCADSTEEGSFEVVFTWADQPPAAPESYHMWGRVEQRDNGTARTIAESDVVPFGFNTPVPLRQVPNGSGYVLVVELLEGPDKSSHPTYYGESESFTLSAGKHVVVAVELALTSTPHVPDGDGDIDSETESPYGAVSIVEALCPGETAQCLVSSPSVTLSIAAERTTFVSVANNMGLDAGLKEFRLADLTRENGRYLIPEWDINDGICASEQDYACDGSHTVYVRLHNDEGYISKDIYSATVTLDTVAPGLLASSSISPNPAAEGVTIAVVLNATEALRESPELIIEPEDLEFALNKEENGIYEYICTDSSRGDEWIGYRIHARLVDLVGNVNPKATLMDPDTNLPLKFKIDRTPPVVSLEPLSHERVASGHPFEIGFRVDDPEVSIIVRVGSGEAVYNRTEEDVLVYQYIPQKDGNSPDPEGSVDITVSATDAAGNTGYGRSSIVFDYSPPVLLSHTCVPGIAPANSVITCHVMLNEDPKDEGTPSILTAPVSLEFGNYKVTGRELEWTHPVAGGESGQYTAQVVNLCDELDNCGDVAISGFEIDADMPVISNARITGDVYDNDRLSDKPGYNALAIEFDLEDAYGTSDVLVTIDGEAEPVAVSCGSPVDGHYICQRELDGTEGEGRRIITVQAMDGAGNAAREDVVANFDFTAPQLVTSFANPSILLPGQNLQYTATFDECIDWDIDTMHCGLRADNQTGCDTTLWALTGEDCNSYKWILQSNGLEDGDYQVVIGGTGEGLGQVCDRYGNCNAEPLYNTDGFSVDGTAPLVAGPFLPETSVVSAQPGFNEIVVVFGVTGAETCQISLALRDGTLLAPSHFYGLQPGQYPQIEGFEEQYLYRWTVTEDNFPNPQEHSGLYNINLSARDEVGNAAFSSEIVEIDLLPPALNAPVQLSFSRPPSCPFESSALTAIGANAHVSISFSLHEPAYDPYHEIWQPINVYATGNDNISFQHERGSDANFTYGADVAHADGTYNLVFEVADAVGNQTTITVLPDNEFYPQPGLTVDTVPPPEANTHYRDQVVYTRAPYGSLEHGPSPYFSLFVGALAKGDDAAMAVLRMGPELTSPLYEAFPLESGDATYQVATSDDPDIYLTFYDAACNPSQPKLVQDIRWVASAGDSEAMYVGVTSKLKNSLSHDVPDDMAILPVAQQESLGSIEGYGAEATGVAENFIEIPDSISAILPAPRIRQGMAYDSKRNVIHVFGGTGNSIRYNDLHNFNLADEVWKKVIIQDIQPSTRYDPAMIYDSQRDKILVYGGISLRGYDRNGREIIGPIFDLWEYNPANEAWREIQVSDPWPMTGDSNIMTGVPNGMIYDAIRQKVVLFGKTGSTYELWEYDSHNEAWEEISYAEPWPSAPKGYSITYDVDSGKTLLFGSSSDAFEVWEYNPFADVGSNIWLQILPEEGDIWPEVSSFHDTENNPNSHEVLLVTGVDANLNLNNHYYKYSTVDKKWTYLEVPESSLYNLCGYKMAFSTGDDAIYILGAQVENFPYISDGRDNVFIKYDFAAANLKEITAARQWPSRRSGQSLVCIDVNCNEMLIFGGATTMGNAVSSELWSLNSETMKWKMIPQSINWPTGRTMHASACNQSYTEMLIFGGTNDIESNDIWENDVWRYDIANGTWEKMSEGSGHRNPPIVSAPVMTFDSLQGKYYLFSCSEFIEGTWNDTVKVWQYDSGENRWEDIFPNGEIPYCARAAIFDNSREKHVLYDGSHFWEYDASSNTMIEIGGSGTPSLDGYMFPNTNFRLTYSRSWETVLLSGHKFLPSGFKIYEYNLLSDGEVWQSVSPYSNALWPSFREYHTSAYIENRDSLLIYGGECDENSIWLWDKSIYQGERPAVLITRNTVNSAYDNALISYLNISLYAAGRGYQLEEATDGATSLLWDAAGGRWQAWAENTAASGNPAAMNIHINSPYEARRYVLGDNQSINIAVSPAYGNGIDPSQLSSVELDFIETTVYYHLPGVGDCSGFTADCSETPDGICETSVRYDVQNCGACGNVCSAPNATSRCIEGLCRIDYCNEGYRDKDGHYRNGCENDGYIRNAAGEPQYYIGNEALSYNDAKSACESLGGDLLIINSSDERKLVEELRGGTTLWLGLSDAQSEGFWVWSDGTVARYDAVDITTNYWDANMPDAVSEGDDCGRVEGILGKWNDVDCTSLNDYICEFSNAATCGDDQRQHYEWCDDGNSSSADGCSNECALQPGTFHDVDGDDYSDYFVSSLPAYRADARQSCEDMNGSLVIVNSSEENVIVRGLLDPGRNYYMGLDDLDTEYAWTWHDGTQAWQGVADGVGFSFTDWRMGRPNKFDASQRYVAFWTEGDWLHNWEDIDDRFIYYVCELPDFASCGDGELSRTEWCEYEADCVANIAWAHSCSDCVCNYSQCPEHYANCNQNGVCESFLGDADNQEKPCEDADGLGEICDNQHDTCNNGPITVTGRGSQWFTLHMYETGLDLFSGESPRLRIKLISPPEADYDFSYFSSETQFTCTGNVPEITIDTRISSSEPGGMDCEVLQNNDRAGHQDDIYLSVLVYHVSGVDCGEWTLELLGDEDTCN